MIALIEKSSYERDVPCLNDVVKGVGTPIAVVETPGIETFWQKYLANGRLGNTKVNLLA
jgi:hypothetical protein